MYNVGSKGQIVISKEVRDRLGIEPGWIALQLVVDDHLEVRFLPPEHSESLAGVLAPYLDEGVKQSLANKDWRDISDAAWEAAARERISRMNEE